MGSRGHALLESGWVGGGKVRCAAFDHKGFEADGTRLAEFLQFVEVEGGETAPQGEIHAGFPFRHGAFLREGFSVEGRGLGVEGHLHHGGGSSGAGSARTAPPTLPVFATRLVVVDVGIHGSRKKNSSLGIHHRLGLGIRVRDDFSLIDPDRNLLHPGG